MKKNLTSLFVAIATLISFTAVAFQSQIYSTGSVAQVDAHVLSIVGGTNGGGSGTTITITGNTNVVQVIQTNFTPGLTLSNGYGAAIQVIQPVIINITSGTVAQGVGAYWVMWTNGGSFFTNNATGYYVGNATNYPASQVVLPSATIPSGWNYYLTNAVPAGVAFQILEGAYNSSGQITVLAAGSSVTVNTQNAAYATNAATATVATNVAGANVTMGNLTGNAQEWAQGSAGADYRKTQMERPIVWDTYANFGSISETTGYQFETNIWNWVAYAASNNFRAYGVRIILLTEGWSGTNRDANGNLSYNTNAFPSGLQATISKVKAAGFDMGYFTSEGKTSNLGFVGEGGNFNQDTAFLVTDLNCRYSQVGDFNTGTNFMNYVNDARDFDTAWQNTGVPVWLNYSGPGQFAPSNQFTYFISTLGNGWLFYPPSGWVDLLSGQTTFSNVINYVHEQMNFPAQSFQGHGPDFNYIDYDTINLANGCPALVEYAWDALSGSGATVVEFLPFAITGFAPNTTVLAQTLQCMSSQYYSDIRNDPAFLMGQSITNWVVTTNGVSCTNEIWLKPMTGQKCGFAWINACSNSVQPFTISYGQLKTIGALAPSVTIYDAINSYPVATLTTGQTFTATCPAYSGWLYEAVPGNLFLTYAQSFNNGLGDGLVFQEEFSEGSNNAVVVEQSPYKWSGKLSAPTAWTSFSGGHYGSAFNGDGTNYVNYGAPEQQSYNLTAMSVSCWFKYPLGPNITNRQALVSMGDPLNNNGDWFLVLATNNAPWFAIQPTVGGGYIQGTSSNTNNDGKWHFFVGTWDGTTAKDYLDNVLLGSEAASGTLPISATASPVFQIGTAHNSGYGGYAATCAIDDVRIYNRSLGTNEISALYFNGVPAGLTTSIQFTDENLLSPSTNTLYFNNGILYKVTQP